MASKRMGKESSGDVPIQKMETVEAGISNTMIKCC
jgi:hypothetical protein